MFSCVLIVTDAVKDKANALAIAMGWAEPDGADSYTVPLFTIGEDPTHWGLHTWASPETVAILQNAQSGAIPDALDGRFSGADISDVFAALIVSVTKNKNPSAHFDEVCSANFLNRIAP